MNKYLKKGEVLITKTDFDCANGRVNRTNKKSIQNQCYRRRNYGETTIINCEIALLELLPLTNTEVTPTKGPITRTGRTRNSRKTNNQSDIRHMYQNRTSNNERNKRSLLLQSQISVRQAQISQTIKHEWTTVENIERRHPSEEPFELTTRRKERVYPGDHRFTQKQWKNTTHNEV